MKQFVIGTREWTYYTPGEADAEGIDYVREWKKGAKKGQWVLTDDGWVAPVTMGGSSHHGLYNWVRIPTGTFNGTPAAVMTSEKRANRSSWTGKKIDRKDPDRRLTTKEKRFAIAFVNFDGDALKAMAAATDWNPEAKFFRQAAAELASRENVKMAITEETRRRLEDGGLSEKWVAAELRKLVEHKETRGGDKARLLELAADMLELRGSKEPQKQGRILMVRSEITQLEREREKIQGGENGRLVEAVRAEAEADPGHESGPGPVREADVSEGVFESDTAVSP